MSEYTTRDWQNGVPCFEHQMPYCTPCFKSLVSMTGERPYKEHSDIQALRDNIIARIMGRVNNSPSGQEFYRPRTRNFFQDSRRKQFAASCQLGETFLVVPIEFIIIGDESSAYQADDDELRAILTKEHLWDTSTPEWMQYNIPTLEEEDTMLLREFQLFK